MAKERSLRLASGARGGPPDSASLLFNAKVPPPCSVNQVGVTPKRSRPGNSPPRVSPAVARRDDALRLRTQCDPLIRITTTAPCVLHSSPRRRLRERRARSHLTLVRAEKLVARKQTPARARISPLAPPSSTHYAPTHPMASRKNLTAPSREGPFVLWGALARERARASAL